MLSLAEARAKILERAVPGEPIEVPLTEAIGLVLAETATGDVDSPPFDRAELSGYAVRAADAPAGARLRVVGQERGRGAGRGEVEVGPDEAAHVAAGDPMPVGADAVVRTEDTRPEPGSGAPRIVEVLRPSAEGRHVVPRGYYLRAGSVLATAGARVRLPMVGLLASLGCAHPVCHRRARVAVVAVGDQLVGPSDAPVMHRERNATGATLVAPCLGRGATAHDLGAVAVADLDAALARALSAPVAIVVGDVEGPIPRALARAGVEPAFSGVSIHPGKRLSYGVLRGASGRVEHHVFHLPPGPNSALTVATLLIGPLIDRLHGAPAAAPAASLAILTAPHRATDDRTWAVPVTLATDDRARRLASPLDHRGKDDLPGFALADALALLPARSGPWRGGEVVEVVPLDP
jgi:molybdopterin molybdotransferase